MNLLWDSCVCCGIAAGGAEIAAVWMWSSCGIDMEISCTIAWDCCDIPMVLLCDSCGVAGVFLGYCRGITVVLLWHCCGNALVLLRYCNGIPVGCFENTWIAVVTRLLWKSIEEVVRQFH